MRLDPLLPARAALAAGRFADLETLILPLAMAGGGEARDLLALALATRGEMERSATVLAARAREAPGGVHPAEQVASLLQQAGLADRAVQLLDRLAVRFPAEERLLLARARLAHRLGDLATAETIAATLPTSPAARTLLGILLAEQGRLSAAEAIFRRAVAEAPGDARGQANLGRLLVAMGDTAPGLAHLAQAVRLRPDDVQIRLNHATALLKSGRFAAGWPVYEARFGLPGHTELPLSRLLPTLAPDDRLEGRTILVTQEEGFGDFLQFMRYLPLLAARGARLLVWAPDELARLLRGVTGLEIPGLEILTGDVEGVSFDWHCPILSLPRAFATTRATIPPPLVPRPDPALVERWRARLPQTADRRVGLVWSGAARREDAAAHAIDRQRSVPLAALAPLGGVPGIAWVSLQAGPEALHRRTTPPPFPLADPMPDVADFADTAALIASLDAVVSVDTAVAHLAASMGKRVILLDRADNCWRWLQGRVDSPWYPTLAIERQTAPGDWTQPVARTAARLMQS